MEATLILSAQIYASLGAAVALAFLTFGIDRIDENARGVWVFRPLLVPGIVLIWPLVALRWLALERAQPEGQRRHRPPLALQPWVALILALVIPTLIFGALVIRQDGPTEAAAELLEPPQ